MATITTRSGKGSPLTNAELDANFTNLNSSKAETGQTFYIGTTQVAINRASASLSLTGVNIDGSAGSATTATSATSATSATKSTNLIGGNATTLLGAIPYQSNTDTTSLLNPNTSTTKKFLRQTGTGTNGAVPAWDTLVDGDIPSALTGKTYNALSLTANATGFSVAGGTSSKTLTVNKSITLDGTDGTTITLPATTGTVALNNQTCYIGTTAVAINRASASLSLTGVNIDGSAGSATTATTATKSTNIVGGNNTTLLGAIPYQSNTDTTTLLSPNTTSTKKFLRMTGTGTNGAAPAWDTIVDGDLPTTLAGKTLAQTTEATYSTNATGAMTLSASNGGMQTWTLTGNVSGMTYTMNNGDSVKLRISDGTAYTFTSWGSIVWVGGSAPSLDLTGYTHVEIWKEQNVVYGCLVGVTAS